MSLFLPLFAAPWNLSVDANLTLNQNAYSNNWVGGELGTLAWAFTTNSVAEKQIHPKISNKNTLKLAYGQTYMQEKDTKKWLDPIKSTDLIDFESVLRFTLGGFVDPFIAGRIETQFYDNRDPSLSRFINPLKLTEALGIARIFIKQEKRELSSRLGFGLKQLIDRDVLVGTNRETQTSNYGGLDFVTDFKTPLAKERITYISKLNVFQAVFYSESNRLPDSLKNNWKYPDINWENIFTASITKYLMVNLYTQLLYDKEITTSVRIKEGLALGLTFKLI
ncbi:MAG: DUF3078 domain-containing protein [candidate division WOR-3 bacterium]